MRIRSFQFLKEAVGESTKSCAKLTKLQQKRQELRLNHRKLRQTHSMLKLNLEKLRQSPFIQPKKKDQIQSSNLAFLIIMLVSLTELFYEQQCFYELIL